MKSIIMCSGKGGTGKSCVAAYTAEALARAGRKTLLIELGGDARSLDLILGVTSAVFGARDVFAKHCDRHEAIVQTERSANLYLMPPGSGTKHPGRNELARLMRETSLDYDFIIVDAAPSESIPVDAADVFLMVLNPDSLSVRSAAETARRLYSMGAREILLVINDVPVQIPPIEGAEDFDGIIDMVGARLLGIVPSSPTLHFCANSGIALDSQSLTLNVFESIAGRLMGKRIPLLVR